MASAWTAPWPLANFEEPMLAHGIFGAAELSAVHMADVATREDLSMVQELGAKWRTPVLPPWLWQLWSQPLPAW